MAQFHVLLVLAKKIRLSQHYVGEEVQHTKEQVCLVAKHATWGLNKTIIPIIHT